MRYLNSFGRAVLLTACATQGQATPTLVTLYKIEGFVRAGNKFYREFGALAERVGVDLEELVR